MKKKLKINIEQYSPGIPRFAQYLESEEEMKKVSAMIVNTYSDEDFQGRPIDVDIRFECKINYQTLAQIARGEVGVVDLIESEINFNERDNDGNV